MLKKTTDRIKQDTEFMAEHLIDLEIILGDPAKCKTEVGKLALDIGWNFSENPEKINFGDMQDLVASKGSQIRNKGAYLAHISNTAGLLRSLIIELEKNQFSLDLPHPNTAYTMGLIHDWSAVIVDYVKTGQQSKEADEFFLAKRFGWERMADQVAMHCDYLGGLRLMAQGAKFPKQEAYTGMKKVLQGDGPLSYKAIEQEFQEFLKGNANFPLMALTVADFLESGIPYFNQKSMDEDFDKRIQDIIYRYHGKAVEQDQTPSLAGQALIDGGIERLVMYKDIIKNLLGRRKIK